MGTHVCQSRFVQEVVAESTRVACRVILAADRYCRSEPVPELRVPGGVGLIAVVEMISIRKVILGGQAMIQAGNAVPKI